MLADPQRVLHVAGMVAPLAREIVLYSNGDVGITEHIKAATKGRRVVIEPRKIISLKRNNAAHSEVAVNFDDGETRTEAFLVSTCNSIEAFCAFLTLFTRSPLRPRY